MRASGEFLFPSITLLIVRLSLNGAILKNKINMHSLIYEKVNLVENSVNVPLAVGCVIAFVFFFLQVIPT